MTWYLSHTKKIWISLKNNRSETEFLQQIGQGLSSKEQFGKPLNAALASIVSEIWKEPLPKDITFKKLDTYDISSNSIVLQVKKVNPEGSNDHSKN